MRINILFPFPPSMPAGGTRVLFEYANQLKRLGHQVTIYYTLTCPFYPAKRSLLLRLVYTTLFMPPNWFSLEKGVKRKVITRIEDGKFEDADILLYTWWSLGFGLQSVNEKKGRKVNLIQDIEFWHGNEDLVRKSYFLPGTKNVVISEHIRKFINSIGPSPVSKVSFAIDHTRFFVKVNPSERDRMSVCMMYSEESRKGSVIGRDALRMVRKRYPDVKINIFSVFDKPELIDFEVDYHKNPSNLPDIMNSSAIFISPSIQEGCALPPMEALHCGCALICSDIEGHSEYAIDNETAILFKSGNAEELAEKIISLMQDDEKRIMLAGNGQAFIRRNTWESSTRELIEVFQQVSTP